MIWSNLYRFNISYALASADPLGHVQGPVGDIISEPRVAGKTLGEERIVAAVGGTVLHYPATKGTNGLLNMFSDINTSADQEYEGKAYAPMDTDDFTLGLMMHCWVKIICRREMTAMKMSGKQICISS